MPDTEIPQIDDINEAQLEEARGEREGLAWWRDEGTTQAENEGPPLAGAASATPISRAAFDLIVFFEVSSRQAYEQKYRHPIWPQGASGVTIGIGYDVGYASREQLTADWSGFISGPMLNALTGALGVTGPAARPLAQALGGAVDIPWEAALAVHRDRVMPRWIALVERSLRHTDAIGPDCLGALVSLTYNRGASFTKAGERFREMRAIRTHMTSKAFDAVPNEIRAMKRLWPNVAGLKLRRDREANLFEIGRGREATPVS